MSAPGELRALSAIAEPDVAVITNVGPAHLGFFSSVDAIGDAKAEILEGLRPGGVAVLNGDDPRVRRVGERSGREVVWFGRDRRYDVSAENWRGTIFGMRFDLRLAGAHGRRGASPGGAAPRGQLPRGGRRGSPAGHRSRRDRRRRHADHGGATPGPGPASRRRRDPPRRLLQRQPRRRRGGPRDPRPRDRAQARRLPGRHARARGLGGGSSPRGGARLPRPRGRGGGRRPARRRRCWRGPAARGSLPAPSTTSPTRPQAAAAGRSCGPGTRCSSRDPAGCGWSASWTRSWRASARPMTEARCSTTSSITSTTRSRRSTWCGTSRSARRWRASRRSSWSSRSDPGRSNASGRSRSASTSAKRGRRGTRRRPERPRWAAS